jgi:hypothetical protein
MDEDMFDPLNPAIKELILWHAIEEIEHKAVAFDAFMSIYNDQAYLRRMMRFSTFTFALNTVLNMSRLHWRGRLRPSWKSLKGFYAFIFGKQGLITCTKMSYKDFYKPGFHPWDHQNQHLVDEWKAQQKHKPTATKEVTRTSQTQSYILY